MQQDQSPLRLKNVGKAVLNDLALIGIQTVAQLQNQDPDHLYHQLQNITRKKQDPCVRDVFAAIIHEANGGQPLPWWHFTKLRKAQTPKNT